MIDAYMAREAHRITRDSQAKARQRIRQTTHGRYVFAVDGEAMDGGPLVWEQSPYRTAADAVLSATRFHRRKPVAVYRLTFVGFTDEIEIGVPF